MASKKESPNTDESMPLMDKNDENNKLSELNKPLVFFLLRNKNVCLLRVKLSKTKITRY